jgi:hypothetical protein
MKGRDSNVTSVISQDSELRKSLKVNLPDMPQLHDPKPRAKFQGRHNYPISDNTFLQNQLYKKVKQDKRKEKEELQAFLLSQMAA